MYRNEKILVGKNSKKEVYLLPSMANRHGLITGASGSGKTITLKVLAESFSEAGIPVFLVDVKGDLAGMAFKGEMNENVEKRVKNLGLDEKVATALTLQTALGAAQMAITSSNRLGVLVSSTV